jgi:predicted dehydrogenase
VATGKKNFFRLEIFGSKGSLAFNLERLNELEYFSLQNDPLFRGNGNIIVTDPSHPYMNSWWPPGHVLGWEHAFIHQVKELMEGIAENKPVSPDFRDGLKCQRVLDAVILSARSGSWVKIQAT